MTVLPSFEMYLPLVTVVVAAASFFHLWGRALNVLRMCGMGGMAGESEELGTSSMGVSLAWGVHPKSAADAPPSAEGERDERDEEFLVRVERGRKLVASEFRRAARAEGAVAGVGSSGSKAPPTRRPFQPLPATDTADDALSVSSAGSGGTHGTTGTFSHMLEPKPRGMALNPMHFEDEEDDDDDGIENFNFALAIDDDDDDDGDAGGSSGVSVGVGAGWSVADSAAMDRISLSVGGLGGGGSGSEDDEGGLEVTGRYG